MGQESADGLAIDKEVAVVVDENGDVESFLKHRSERHSAAKAREVTEIADDAVRIVCRTGECETDC